MASVPRLFIVVSFKLAQTGSWFFESSPPKTGQRQVIYIRSSLHSTSSCKLFAQSLDLLSLPLVLLLLSVDLFLLHPHLAPEPFNSFLHHIVSSIARPRLGLSRNFR